MSRFTTALFEGTNLVGGDAVHACRLCPSCYRCLDSAAPGGQQALRQRSFEFEDDRHRSKAISRYDPNNA